jgi:hypothetical protein
VHDEKGFAGYLNDHLGGSETALKITERLAEQHGEDEIGTYMRRLRAEIEEGRATEAALDWRWRSLGTAT